VAPPPQEALKDPAAKQRLMHARCVLDHFFQQDADLPLTLGALQLQSADLVKLIGETTASQAFAGGLPGPEQPLPRRVIGVLQAALRNLEVDTAALEAAESSAKGTLMEICAGTGIKRGASALGDAAGTTVVVDS
jgi:hypothetical protein